MCKKMYTMQKENIQKYAKNVQMAKTVRSASNMQHMQQICNKYPKKIAVYANHGTNIVTAWASPGPLPTTLSNPWAARGHEKITRVWETMPALVPKRDRR